MSPPELLNRHQVASLLGVPIRTLTWWTYGLRDSRRYTKFEIQRAGRDPRTIHAPARGLKQIQQTLAEELNKHYRPAHAVHGYVPGRGITSNARIHANQLWVLRVDIKDFFPSINFGRVYGIFRSYPFNYSNEVASTLAHICCLDNSLPQGAPTSPIVSNLVCRSLDSDLSRLARAERCYYTRYADDLCFSTNKSRFPENLAVRDDLGNIRAGDALVNAINSQGFRLNDSKTRLMRRSQRQRVTGLIVNKGPNVDSDYVRALRSLLYVWRRYGRDEAAASFLRANPRPNWPPGKPLPTFERMVQGRVQFVGSVKGWHDAVYRRLAKQLCDVDSTFRPTTLRLLSERKLVRLYVEGDTDIPHLRAAKAHFASVGEFLNLDFEFPDDAATGGGSQLKERLLGLADNVQDVPTVCLFDSDDTSLLNAVVRGSKSRNHANNVMAVVIAAPPWRSDDRPLCIEMLYQDADLGRADSAGRRLYLTEEFDLRTGHHRDSSCRVHIPNTTQKRLIPEAVISLDTGESALLSKRAFAEAVETAAPGFEGVTFDGFRPTFESISDAVARFSLQTA